MPEIIVLCEGQTEREFCRSVVAPFIWEAAGVELSGTLVGKPNRKRGGVSNWATYRAELLRLAKERRGRYVSVLVDYYGMPESWPGRTGAEQKQVSERGTHVECALREDLAGELENRFIPCVQLHEFESLLFTEPETAALSLAIAGQGIDHETLAKKMTTIVHQCGGTVEQIDDSPQTAPSKRLVELVPGYNKVAWGVVAATDIKVASLREHCPWFERWLAQLEQIGEG